MRLSVELLCPACGHDPEAGPAETFGGVITRRAVSCDRCGWGGVVTTTLVRKSARDLDHIAEAV